MILVSPTEPPHVKNLGKVSSAPENVGCDILLTSRVGKLGIQRKVFPNDLIASISDGRLSDQLTKMMELDRAVIILVGYPSWTRDGILVHKDYSGRQWTFGSIWGQLVSAALLAGVAPLWVRDEGELVDLVGELDRWNTRVTHTTLRTRGRPKAKGWGVSERLKQAHFLQGLPDIGPELAERIVEHYGGIPMRWTTTRKGILDVAGVGPVKADRLGRMVDWADE